METVSLDKYLTNGINNLVKNILKGIIKNPKETAFLLQYLLTAKKAEALRHKSEKNGEHIPLFLIASITNRCNLHCSGCYNRARGESSTISEMNDKEWRRIFKEAAELGISVILLAGGEPFLRIDVLEQAARYPSILFPVFTNGTMLDAEVLKLFEKHRNLIPVISIEGDEGFTDTRRGQGIYAIAILAMEKIKELDLPFGVSITVTNKNLYSITSEETIFQLKDNGVKAVVFVEYVPVINQDLVLDDKGRIFLGERIAELEKKSGMFLLSFPGDEKKSGGCIAAGRGLFHISAKGNAEPCPFSPYSDTNMKTVSLREALKSPLFAQLRNDNIMLADHKGGCVLFDKVDKVRSIVGA